MLLLTPFLLASLIALAFFTLVFLIGMHRDDNSIVDLAWSPGFILLAVWSFLRFGAPTPTQVLVTALVLLWGCRLYLHLWLRKRGQPEDFRYAQWRKAWGKSFVWRSYLQVYALQAILLAVIILPVLVVNANPVAGIPLVAVLGGLLWLKGFVWESVADAQLARFKADRRNKGKIMARGLWAYSRHPNYFGESLQWWGIGLVALAVPGGWVGLIGPAVLTFLLLRVSGVPMLEAKWAKDKEYRAYVKRTSAFVPLPPRR